MVPNDRVYWDELVGRGGKSDGREDRKSSWSVVGSVSKGGFER